LVLPINIRWFWNSTSIQQPISTASHFTALVLQCKIPSPHLTQFYVIRDEYWKRLYFDLRHLFNDLASLSEFFSIKWGDFESIFIWDTSYAAFLLGLYCEIFSLEHNRHDPALYLVAQQYAIRTPQGSIIGQSHCILRSLGSGPGNWVVESMDSASLGVDSVFLEQLDSNQNKCMEMWMQATLCGFSVATSQM
jgi:hypothetical protein